MVGITFTWPRFKNSMKNKRSNTNMTKYFFLTAFLIVSVCASSQNKPAVPFEDHYVNLRKASVGNNAYETVKFVEPRWRLAGNTGFNESIYYVEKILQQAGYKKEQKGEADGPLTYRIET